VISVASSKFSDSSGNLNADGSDANNSVTLTVDTLRPTIFSAETNSDGTKLVLTYDEILSADTASKPDFSVTCDGVKNPVKSVVVSGCDVTLTLANIIEKTQIITLTYTDPSTSNDINAIQDLFGNDAASSSIPYTANNSKIDLGSTSESTVTNNGSSSKTESDIKVFVTSDNTLTVGDGTGEGLWLNLNVVSANTSLQNSLTLVDQNNQPLGSIGATQYSRNLGNNSIFIKKESTVSFQQLSNNQPINSSPQQTITHKDDGTFKLRLNDDTLDNDHDDLIVDISQSFYPQNSAATAIAAKQQQINNTILDLTSIPAEGQTLQITLKSDCSFINRFALVKLNKHSSDDFTVNGLSNTAGDDFDQAITESLINPCGSITTATGIDEQIIEWTIPPTENGFYAPVLINPSGDIHTYGSTHVKNLGTNFFGFEDDSIISRSDWDFNDLTAKFEII